MEETVAAYRDRWLAAERAPARWGLRLLPSRVRAGDRLHVHDRRRRVQPHHRVPGLGQPRLLRRAAQLGPLRRRRRGRDRLVPLPAPLPPGPPAGGPAAVAGLPVRLDRPPDRRPRSPCCGGSRVAIGPCGPCSSSWPGPTSGRATSTCSWPSGRSIALTWPAAWAGLALTKVTAGGRRAVARVPRPLAGVRPGRHRDPGRGGAVVRGRPGAVGRLAVDHLRRGPRRPVRDLGARAAGHPRPGGHRAAVVGGAHGSSLARPDRVHGAPCP